MRSVTPVCILMQWLLIVCTAQALDLSKGSAGANHDQAHPYASGLSIRVGILDTVPFGIPTPHHLGDRLVAQYNFYNSLPSQEPALLIDPVDDHERLAADIVAGNDPLNTGVAPQAQVYLAAINDLNLQSRRAASAWLHEHHNVRLFNLSAGFGANTNGASTESLYWDWFMHANDVLLIAAAGNSGYQITTPADSFNGIAVGAYDQATGAAWSGSAFAINAGDTEVRGKPDILAPGVWIGDGISFNGTSALGTSFAAPHVTGAAALLVDYAQRQPAPDILDRRGIKALILNSARKRNIVGPELLSPTSADNAGTHPTYDKDYLDCNTGTCVFRDAATAATTAAWTPAGWSFSGGRFSVTKPLDDQQGAGYLDATRAIINLAGGNFAPSGTVEGIGWDQGTIAASDAPSLHTYSLNQMLVAGSFLTATLVWDRIAVESDGDGIVDDDDTYAFGELANLDLRLLNASNEIIAESISTTDNVEQMHVPLPTSGDAGDYKLQVIHSGGAALLTDFALAWWSDPTPLVPGDYNLDGTVDALDYQVWRASFASSNVTSPLIRGDGNNDGIVNAADYAIWRNHFGQTWSAAAIATAHATPECHTILMASLSICGLALLRRAR